MGTLYGVPGHGHTEILVIYHSERPARITFLVMNFLLQISLLKGISVLVRNAPPGVLDNLPRWVKLLFCRHFQFLHSAISTSLVLPLFPSWGCYWMLILEITLLAARIAPKRHSLVYVPPPGGGPSHVWHFYPLFSIGGTRMTSTPQPSDNDI